MGARTGLRCVSLLVLGLLGCHAQPLPDRSERARTELEAAALKRGCDDGGAAACLKLGLLYARGRGVPRNLARAAGLYERACDAGLAEACSNLGALFFRGEG